MSTAHPGEIVFIDGATGNVVSREKAADLPETMIFADTERGRVPVVRVVAHTMGDRREILEYGPDGQLLRSTMQFRSP